LRFDFVANSVGPTVIVDANDSKTPIAIVGAFVQARLIRRFTGIPAWNCFG